MLTVALHYAQNAKKSFQIVQKREKLAHLVKREVVKGKVKSRYKDVKKYLIQTKQQVGQKLVGHF